MRLGASPRPDELARPDVVGLVQEIDQPAANAADCGHRPLAFVRLGQEYFGAERARAFDGGGGIGYFQADRIGRCPVHQVARMSEALLLGVDDNVYASMIATLAP